MRNIQVGDDVKKSGWEHGYAGFPSSSNPYDAGSFQYESWMNAHREGVFAAMDDGAYREPEIQSQISTRSNC